MHKNMYYKNLIIDIFAVTFRKEGVDWNREITPHNYKYEVTFRKEGVDWNVITPPTPKYASMSPSARKVWIEIVFKGLFDDYDKSPSARKVWIEMYNHDNDGQYGQIVTFRKEGVDWNHLRLLP